MSLVHIAVEKYTEILESNKDPLVDSWFLMKSPLPILGILILYLYSVLRLGPRLMKNRAPFDLKYVLIAYNAYQVIFSIWFCSKAFRIKHNFFMLFTHCNNLPPHSSYADDLLDGAWWYIFSKIVELLDTVFFVLRKKQSQVSFLHVYHHSIMLVISWSYLKFFPGEQGAVAGFVNTAVHSVMYFYYLVAAIGPQYHKYLWWKKYVTCLQLAQFVMILVYLVSVVMIRCPMSKATTIVFAPVALIFFYLFLDYYRKEYIKKETKFMETKLLNKLH